MTRTVFVGEQVTISCTASADPLPQIYILKDDNPQVAEVAFESIGMLDIHKLSDLLASLLQFSFINARVIFSYYKLYFFSLDSFFI